MHRRFVERSWSALALLFRAWLEQASAASLTMPCRLFRGLVARSTICWLEERSIGTRATRVNIGSLRVTESPSLQKGHHILAWANRSRGGEFGFTSRMLAVSSARPGPSNVQTTTNDSTNILPQRRIVKVLARICDGPIASSITSDAFLQMHTSLSLLLAFPSIWLLFACGRCQCRSSSYSLQVATD